MSSFQAITNVEADAPSFKCAQCSQAYRRKEHLQRHQTTHAAERTQVCHQCKAAFYRSDILNRHLKTCTGKRAKISSSLKRACQACAKGKRACDGVSPTCSNCSRKAMPCVYPSDNEYVTMSDTTLTSDLNSFPVDPIIDDMPLDLGAVGDWYHAFQDQLPSSSSYNCLSLQFLERFTRTDGLIASFDCLSESDREAARTFFLAKIRYKQSESRNERDHLSSKSEEIVELVEEVISFKPRNSPLKMTWSGDLREACRRFFSTGNIRLYLEMFWAFWHPNVNFIHRPSFDPNSAKAILVASMVVMGASVSPVASDREAAKAWFTCVEEMVFQDDDFCDGGDDTSRSFPSRQKIQALQAAYIVCLYQNWEGSDSSKRRIRRFRFSTMVAVARDIGMIHARHSMLQGPGVSTFSWEEFAIREELIRVFLWIFLLDTAFVIFNNLPPRMAIKEMRMHLASSEASFQAPNSDECFRQLQTDANDTKHTLSSLCENLCSEPMSPTLLAALADLGPLNLFALTSALHSLSFQIQQCFGYDKQMTPIRTALDNWILIWQTYSDYNANTTRHNPLFHQQMTPNDMWKRIGFSRYAYEYWTLAKLIVDRISISTLLKDATDHEFADGAAEDSLLEKYDDTSMKQVNDLIMEFQKVMI